DLGFQHWRREGARRALRPDQRNGRNYMLRNTLAATAAAFALLAGSALAQDNPVELRLAHWVPPQHPLQVHGLTEWINSSKEASGGSITVTIYPAQQLGQAGDHYDMARDGLTDIAFNNPG